MSTLRMVTLAAVAALAAPAGASYHTFVVDQLYSSADGEVQFVQLREAQGSDGQHQFAATSLTSSQALVTKTFLFPSNLPSSNTANRKVLIASTGYVNVRNADKPSLPAPDFVMPNRFLFTDGGTVVFADSDRMTYAALPVGGSSALYRGGALNTNAPTNFNGDTSLVPIVPTLAVEFHHGELDHYFISSLAPDIDALDAGRVSGWMRTGQQFHVMPAFLSFPGIVTFGPVCRFYIPPQHGDSHFFSASPEECAEVLQLAASDPNFRGYVHETASAFYAALPSLDLGVCGGPTIPVYRLWNQRADSNHRYTSSATVKAEMIASGHVAEGYGPEAVAFCAFP